MLAPALALAHDDKSPADEKTSEVLKKLGVAIKDAQSLHCEMTVVTTVTDGDEKREAGNLKVTVDVQRPNKFALRVNSNKDKAGGLEVVSDVAKLNVLAKRLKQYTEDKAPEKLTPVAQRLQRLGVFNTGMLFQNVLAADPVEALMEGVTEAKHAGMEKVGGKDCHHLKFKQQGMDWDLWVAAEGDAFVLKASSEQDTPNGKLVISETYSNWKRNAEPAKDAFNFTPPEEAKKVDQLGGGGRGQAPTKVEKDN